MSTVMLPLLPLMFVLQYPGLRPLPSDQVKHIHKVSETRTTLEPKEGSCSQYTKVRGGSSLQA